jgi:hypothetical protein
MFLLLVFAVILHQTYASTQEGKQDWPMRIFFGRCIEFVGRVTVFPIVAILFLLWIRDVDEKIRTGMIAVTIVVWIFVFVREIRGLNHTCKESYRELLAKLKNEEILLKELSSLEIFVINYYQFNKCSCSPYTLSAFLNQGAEVLEIPETSSIPIRRYSIAASDELFSMKESPQHLLEFENHMEFSTENPQLRQPHPTGESRRRNRSQSSGKQVGFVEPDHHGEENSEEATRTSRPSITSTSMAVQNGQFQTRRIDSDDDLDRTR